MGWGGDGVRKFSSLCGAGRGWSKTKPCGLGTKTPSFSPTLPPLPSLIIGCHLEKGCIGFRPCGLGFAKRLHINLRVAQSIPQSYLNGTKSSSTAALIESIDFLFCSLRVGQFCPVWVMDKQPQFYHFSPFFYSLFFNPTIHCQ